ncbi:MAG: DUF134 domain-containing protein [Ruthenibacterium sp.]
MARPIKCRRVCAMPQTLTFAPTDGANGVPIVLTVDEYEVIRLVDWLCLKQEDAALQLQVSRPTIQSIYETARKKIADALVNGKQLVIHGGRYEICKSAQKCCGKNCSRRVCDTACTKEKESCPCSIPQKN